MMNTWAVPSTNEKKSTKLGYMKLRFQLCLFLCGALFCMMFSNLSLSITLLAMVDDPQSHLNHSHMVAENISINTTIDNITNEESAAPKIPINHQHLKWSPQMQGLLYSAINMGRLFTPISGVLADRFDSFWLLAIALAIAGTANALIPISAIGGYGFVISCRVLIGLSDAMVIPCVNQIVSAWYPEKVRNSALSWITAGRQLGVLVVYPIGGVFDDALGWQFVYYLGSILFGIWLVCWIPFVFLRLIRRRRKIRASPSPDQPNQFSKDRPKLPWKSMLKSTSMWANMFSVLCHEIPFNILLVFMPKYLRGMLKFAPEIDGVISAVPIACFLAMKLIASQIDNIVKSKKFMTHTRAAKIFNAIGCAGLGGFLLSLGSVDGDRWVILLVLLCLATSSAGFHTPGCIGTLVSIAPSFAGVISGFAFLLISISSIINPIVVESVTPDETPEQWKRVMMGAGIVALLPLLVFTKWGSAEEQDWAKIEKLKEPPTVSAMILNIGDMKTKNGQMNA